MLEKLELLKISLRVNGKRKHYCPSIFIGFAPADDPNSNFVYLAENGYWGSRWAAPISSLIIEKYLKKEINRKWLENYILEEQG